MKPRAFVVMPFKQKPVPQAEVSKPQPGRKMRKDEQHADLVVDFDSVWEDLIKPALAAAGCEPFRADSELSAGDIRTDMFFELVTADLVVADLSIPNPNIYYELGVRDGVCARGVFIINGGWDIPRPFDVSQDRSFSYRGDLFQVGARPPAPTGTGDTEDLATARAKEVKRMAEMFGRAVASDPHETGSPVYSHLPGLKAANWAEIDISRARYFWSLQSDWQERVRRAQELVRPGHILTISQYAPTRVHRTKILSEAARALIGLEQFSTAESILEEILEVTPEDTEAQLYLAIAQINGQDILRAERQLRKMLQQHQGDPQTNMALGYVYRLLWYLEWKTAKCPRERAAESPRLLLESIRSFYNVQARHPDQYLSGYNALLLMAVAAELFPDLQLPAALVDRKEMSRVVRYAAYAARQTAEETGDYDTQFWSSVAIAGLDMIDKDKDAAIQAIHDACAVPSATLFNLRWFEERLHFLDALDFEKEVVSSGLCTVQAALQAKLPGKNWNRVLVCRTYSKGSGHDTGTGISDDVKAEITRVLDQEWKIGSGDLAICTLCTKYDIFLAEQCFLRTSNVRLLILEPTDAALAAETCQPGAAEWADKRCFLIERAKDEAWFHHVELGGALDSISLNARHNRWLLNTARVEAERATAVGAPRLYGLVVSDGSAFCDSKSQVDEAEDPSFFVAHVRSADGYQGIAKQIDISAVTKS